MSEDTNNRGETPVNDGGGQAPQETEPTEDEVAAETPVNQGGGGA